MDQPRVAATVLTGPLSTKLASFVSFNFYVISWDKHNLLSVYCWRADECWRAVSAASAARARSADQGMTILQQKKLELRRNKNKKTLEAKKWKKNFSWSTIWNRVRRSLEKNRNCFISLDSWLFRQAWDRLYQNTLAFGSLLCWLEKIIWFGSHEIIWWQRNKGLLTL